MGTEVINVKKYKGVDFVYIGRGTPFGNANSHFSGELTREESIDAYQYDFNNRINRDLVFRFQVLSLHGKKLGCSCKPFLRCHGDIIKIYLDSINDIDKERGMVINLIKTRMPELDIEGILDFKNKRRIFY